MIIGNRLLRRGFSINLLKDARLQYPRGIWEALDKETKKVIIDNLVYLKLSPYAMLLDEVMDFDFSRPFLKGLGDMGVVSDIPRVAEEDKIPAKSLIDKFQNGKISFVDEDIRMVDRNTGEAAVLGLSFGKDSLLSYALCKEVGLSTKLVCVEDSFDIEMVHKRLLIERFEGEFGEKVEMMYDEIDDISCHKRINTAGSEGIVGSNAMNGYMLMFFPFAFNYGAGRIIFGNEQNFNDYFVSKEGFRVYPSYEQSSEWMIEQNKALKVFTNDNIKVSSFVEPLYNIAEVKVLFNRYPKIAKYQMSCSLSNTRKRKERWCYNCPMCAKAYLYLKANGIGPGVVSFGRDMFEKEYAKFYPLFNENPERIYEKPRRVRDEQLFAFYLAFKNRCRGYLIEKFKETFLVEAKEREDELYNRFFGLHDAPSIDGEIREKINSIYKEELAK